MQGADASSDAITLSAPHLLDKVGGMFHVAAIPGTVQAYLGEIQSGIAALQSATATANQDASRYRRRREQFAGLLRQAAA